MAEEEAVVLLVLVLVLVLAAHGMWELARAP